MLSVLVLTLLWFLLFPRQPTINVAGQRKRKREAPKTKEKRGVLPSLLHTGCFFHQPKHLIAVC